MQETITIHEQKIKGTRINKLLVEGFKSFAKRTELIFGERFNTILGPNGSGKSNVADALCFVLGKSSSKSLRAEKSAHLIYNGGKTKQPAKTAEVSIFFDNENQTFPFQEKEVKITRIVRQDGASKYRINNKTVTRQEVIELLNTAKIDPDGYNIIIQGDITRLVEMNPADRRMIIEEIAGIGIYEDKKQQAINELTKVDEKLNEAEIVLKERESHLKELKKEKEQATAYKEIADKIKIYKASQLHKQYETKEKAKKTLEEQKNKIKQKISHLKAKAESIENETQKNKNILAELNKEIEQKGEKEMSEIQKHIETLKVEIATNTERIQGLTNSIQRLKEQEEKTTKQLKETEEKKKSLDTSKKEKDEQKKQNETQINEIERKLEGFKKEKGLDDIHAIDASIEKIDKELETLQQEVHSLREKQQELLREKDRTEFELQTIQKQAEKYKEQQEQHKSEIAQLKEKKANLKRITIELNEILNKDSKQAAQLAKTKKDLQEKRQTLAALEVRNTKIKESNTDETAKKVIQNCQGAIGTVAKLGTVEEKYALALEVAAGNRLASIIVETETVAQKCITFLRERKIGVATFLPLDKVKSAEDEKIPKQQGIIGKAIELVTFEPRYKNAFSHVFGNTIVVTAIDTARKIGIGKYRMVTLQGDLIEKSGSMTGGFRQKKSAFKEKDLTETLEKIQAQITEYENEEETLEQERRQNDNKITELRQEKAALEGEIIKSEKILHYTEETENDELKTGLEKRQTKIEQELEKLREDVETKTNEITKLMTERQQQREKTKELRNPAVIAELHAYEQQKKEIQEQQTKTSEDLSAITANLQTTEEQERKNKHALTEIKEETEQTNYKSKELETTIKAKQKALTTKEKEQEKASTEFKEMYAKRDKITQEISESERKKLLLEEESRREEITENTISTEETRIQEEINTINETMAQYQGIQIENKDEETLKRLITENEIHLAKIGNVNLRALDIYDTAEQEFQTLQQKKDVLIKEKQDVINFMNDIEKNKTDLFLNTLHSVNDHFQRIFTELNTKGRTATLELQNKEKPFEDGLSIRVEVNPGKYLDIRSLSGGEKTLTALSFLFAIQEHEPASFYVMDEVDAALDKANSEKLSKLIRNYSQRAQYIIISHNDAIINEADILYGVSMNPEQGKSNIVSLKV